jgi:hypothetical protein
LASALNFAKFSSDISMDFTMVHPKKNPHGEIHWTTAMNFCSGGEARHVGWAPKIVP